MAKKIDLTCKVPNCKKDSQILSKHGEHIQYMNTCSKHWNDLIPQEIKLLLKGNQNEYKRKNGIHFQSS
jgi:hypothetical protein